MADIAGDLQAAKLLVDGSAGASSKLLDESAGLSGAAKGVSPAEYDFKIASINHQTDIALGYPHVRSPYYDVAPPVQRFPELTGTGRQFDAVVIGAGLLGTQTARALAESGKTVAVLDSGLVADGASGALVGMGTRGIDGSYPALQDAMGDQFGPYVQRLRQASMSVRDSGRGLSQTRYGVSSHYYSYDDDPDFRAEYDALSKHDPAVRWSSGPAAAQIFPAVGDRPAASSVISFLNESRVNPREFSLAMLDHPNISTFEYSPVDGIRTGMKGDPIEVHTANGAVVRGNSVISAVGGAPTMFEDRGLLTVEQARMMRGYVPQESYPFTRDNYFDFGNAVSRNDEDYAWHFMPQPGVVDLGADSRFLTGGTGDRATQGVAGLKDNFEYTYPGVYIPRGSKAWGSVLYGTKTGGPLVDTLPTNRNVILATGAGGTGLVNGDQVATTVRDMVDGKPTSQLYSPRFIDQVGQRLDEQDAEEE